MTPSALSPPSAPRVRRPSKRYQEYDQDADEGSLVTFSQSVGVHIPPPEPGTFTSEQVKKQRAIAIARGNATRPAPLPPPPKRHKANDPHANDYQFEELDTEEDRMEWLYQALESLGTKKKYCEDPEFDDSAILFEVYEDLRLGGGANRDDTPLPTPKPQARGASPVDDNVNDEIDDKIDDDANDNNDNNNTNDNEGQGRGSKHAKHEDMLLRTFGPDATPLVQYLVTNLKIEMPAVCGYPEHVKSIDHPNRPQLEAWLTKLWVAANMKYRPDQPRLPFQDSYGYHVRKQCAPIRNHVKKWAERMVGSYYNLNRAHPNHAEKACDLIDGHKWLSPTLANNKHVFKHPIISNTITYLFFHTSRSVGSKNLERFTPLVPIETIAYVCAIIRHLIMAFLTKDEHASNLNAKDNADNFCMYLDMLKRIEDSDEAALKNIWSGITLAYLKTRTKPNLLLPIQLNLGPRQEVDMEAMHEIQELLGDDAPDIDEWAAVSKGKGRASRTGPS
ncbi:hypothetical protein FRC06_003296, partial [Ceratobasidium sp. 370]